MCSEPTERGPAEPRPIADVLIILLIDHVKHLILFERQFLLRVLGVIIIQSLDDGHV
jgi:hypothetical protein